MRRTRFAIRAAALTTALVAFVTCTPVDSPNVRPADSGSLKHLNDVSANADPVIVAAGDIVCGNNTPNGTACKHAQTAALIGTINPNAVLLLGDNQYEDGTLAEYNALYGPTWGQYKSITYPSVGNHEYQTANAAGYFDYFNGVGVQTGRAGDRSKGYYSYDIGAWHLIAINSNCGSVGGCGVGSAQEVWLKADLAAHPNVCTVAYWHHPRFSSGQHSNDASTQALWDALNVAKADLILAGHDHNYERFAPMTATGVLDNTNGIRSFVVGTGGKEQRSLGTTKANSVVRSNNSFGVLKLTLHPTSYDWQFVALAGDPLNDSGSSTCVGASTANQNPTASISSPANGSSFVQGSAISFAGTGTDPEDGTLTGASLAWTSSIGGVIGTGTSFSNSTLAVGTHVITLTAKDAQGLTALATVSVTITTAPTVNQKPVPTVTSPASGSVFTAGSPVTFTGSAIDPEDGAITGQNLIWTIQFNGGQIIGYGNSFTTTTLPTGSYTFSLLAVDSKRAIGSLTTPIPITVSVSTPTNQAPSATISAPANGASFVQGASVSFNGSGTDPEDGVLTGTSLAWTSSINGAIGTGASFSKNNLSFGTHTITLTVTDSKGATKTASRSISITAPPNQLPSGSISSPANGTSVVQGTSVSFSGTGSDPEDGSLSGSSLVWTSSIDGSIGTGTLFSKNSLSVGSHTITLTVTDSRGATNSSTRSLTVTAPTSNQPPVAFFTVICGGQGNPRQCNFDASGSTDDKGIVSYLWDYNNGFRPETKTTPQSRNNYSSAGSYTVTLVVTDTNGATATFSKTVVVP